MGCGTSKASSPGGRNEFKSDKGLENTSRSVEKKNFIPQVGVGRPVGGGAIPTDRREAQLAAAEKRAMKEATRGLGQAQRGLELNDSARKQELIGRIHAVYNSMNKEIPMGLNIASVEQLQHHYEAVKRA